MNSKFSKINRLFGKFPKINMHEQALQQPIRIIKYGNMLLIVCIRSQD